MTRICIAYGTTEGQSARIAQYMADLIREHGHQVDVVDIKAARDRVLEGHDGVIIGASIHMGKHKDYVRDFVTTNRAALQRLPSAMFSVSLAAHGDMENAQAYVEGFAAETGWHPAQIGLFAGALPYTRYGFFKRRMMRRIVRAKPGNLDTDMSRDYDYTDWEEVGRFAEDFLRRVLAADQGTAGARSEEGGFNHRFG